MARKPRYASDGAQLLTPSQERLLGYIASETVRIGGVVATKLELARAIGCNERTVDRAVTCLRNKGLLDVAMRFDEHGGQLSSFYRIVAPTAAAPAGADFADAAPASAAANAAAATPAPATPASATPAAATPASTSPAERQN